MEKIVEKHKDFNIEYFIDLMCNTFYHNNSWKEQFRISEESIVKFYKEDVIKYGIESMKEMKEIIHNDMKSTTIN